MTLYSWIRTILKIDHSRNENDDHLATSIVCPTRDGDDYKAWIPFAENVHDTQGLKMKTRGEYSKGYPKGLVVHWTSGWHLKKGTHIRPFPLKNDQSKLKKMARKYGIRTIKGGVKNGYNFLAMDILGKIYQSRPLTKWGYHAGRSYWPTVGLSVSNEFAGIEILNPSTLRKTNGKFMTWFKYAVPDYLVRQAEARENIAKGNYYMFSEEQETELLRLCVFLYNNSPVVGGEKVFEIGNIVGHDEVSPGRKSDPGHALSCSMREFRNKVGNAILKEVNLFV